ncbi:arabinose-5-phosphate isomerase [Mucilaginibacter sp. PPCGB 2223]|uniref:KpsF/GutQ family sugar-phosphate isomerase n=1 Tax=Mucilaginibacter sp. PPCGB 2223 TaxID=1886027 RepID=UPI000824DC99|nr:KpsF/GutQ family sugar-phosphate isomerase [Mucilaginibacter sp. PPCGB 2223]OCX53939.1 arabinose-5-phosphate isomerase [Mucilaginibacter sp. PPCGB 2223]
MKDIARRVFDIEIESLLHVASQLDDEFDRVIQAILKGTGKVIITGIGKSGLIGKKIAATLSSTGTSSFFMHPGEAFHGDLGMIGADDIVIMISYSGETDEVLKLIPYLKWNKNILIALTGNAESTIARNSDYHLNVSIKHEACPLKLAPTSSTTAALVMGDAIAVALMESREFKETDFARFHPGGSLGRKLVLKVKDLMRTDNLPFINTDATFTELVLKMSEGRIGMVIVGTGEKVEGIVTDGDLRRALVQIADTSKLNISDMMNRNPVIVDENEYLNTADNLMIDKKIVTVLVGSAHKHTVKGVYQIYHN